MTENIEYNRKRTYRAGRRLHHRFEHHSNRALRTTVLKVMIGRRNLLAALDSVERTKPVDVCSDGGVQTIPLARIRVWIGEQFIPLGHALQEKFGPNAALLQAG